ncbi:MAG: zinc-ribbon domain-containing protein [Candidatus Helarchaeota archaeon]|nr:zinc-ribbon domain-containing protein [Candidatus Helarchaeota archaeon]
MNKPLTIFGIISIFLGVIGGFYIIEFWVAAIVGIALIIIGVGVDIGKFSKSSIGEDSVTEFCPKCGSAIKKGSKFCPYCREKL